MSEAARAGGAQPDVAAANGKPGCPACADHNRCCGVHRKHVDPHRGCILR